MKTRFFEGIEVSFNDFPEEMQKKFYEAKKDEFREDASKSQFASIRLLVAEDEGTSNAVLNEMLKEEVTDKYKQYEGVLKAIFARENFTITEEKRKICAKSSAWNIRLLIVKDEKTSNELLNEILKEEVTNEDKQVNYVLKAIFAREDFKITEENRKLCAKSSAWNIRLLIVKDEKTSNELLNEILKEEVTNEDKQVNYVLKAIFAREDFKITEENRKLCAKSRDREMRLWIVKDKNTSSELLDEILKEEVTDKHKQDIGVFEAIFARENFTITEEKQKLCAKSSAWNIRYWIVKDKNTSNELLNEILKEEVTNEDKQDYYVLKEIFAREDFVITEENKRICKKSNQNWIRDLVK